MNYKLFFYFLAITTSYSNGQKWKSIFQKISQEKQYSSFNGLITNNREVKLNMHYSDLTVFAPENAAFDRFEGPFHSDLAFYHMSFQVKTINQLRSSISLESVGENPPLWITKSDDELFVNNAKILQNHSNYLSRSRGDTGKQQVLHVIDEVLDSKTLTPISHPSAYDLLTNSKKWKLGSNTVTNYLHKIQENKLEHIFKQEGTNTFFIPVDSGIDSHKFSMINKYIIFGQVVPNLVLFTRPTKKDFSLETMANGDYIYSLVSFKESNDKLYVRSNTVLGDSNNRKGEFLAEVLQANIPVKNGVVHLISQPLGISERLLKSFPYVPVLDKLSTDPTLDTTYQMGERSGFNQLLDNSNKTFTYFVVKDVVWRKLYNNSLQPIEDDYKILGRHLIVSETPFSMEKLLSLSRASNYSDLTLSTTIGPLRITVLKMEGEYFIKWYNKYIKVVRPDYECTNGVIHVLNAPIATFKRRVDVEELHEEVLEEKVENPSLWNSFKDVVRRMF